MLKLARVARKHIGFRRRKRREPVRALARRSALFEEGRPAPLLVPIPPLGPIIPLLLLTLLHWVVSSFILTLAKTDSEAVEERL